jgi:hypothetical protein
MSWLNGLVHHITMDTDGADINSGITPTKYGTISHDTDGDRQYAEVSTGSSYDYGASGPFTFGTDDFTIGAWFRADSTAAMNNAGRTLFNSGVWAGSKSGYHVDVFGGNLRCFIGGGGSYSYLTTPVTAGVLYHATLVREGTTMKLFIDGVQVAQNLSIPLHDTNHSLKFAVGGHYNGTWYRYYDGLIDDIRMFDRALPQADITSMYEAGKYLTDGLVTKYKLDTDGTDSIGGNNLVTTGAVSYTTVDSSPSANFSGGKLQPTSTVDLSGNVTLSFWARWNTATTHSGNTYAQMFAWNSPSTVNYLDFYLFNGKLRSQRKAAGGSFTDSRGTINVPSGSWHMITTTIDASSGVQKFFVDGVLDSTSSVTAAGFTAAGTSTYGESASRTYDGALDDIRSWNRVLSESEVTALHVAGAEVPPVLTLSTNLTSLYPLTSDVTDSQGNYNGTNVGVTFANDAVMGDVAVFNGGYYTIPKGLPNGITSSYSIGMWLKPDALQSASQTLFMDGQSGSVYSSLQGFIVADGRVAVYHYPANSAAGAQNLHSTTALPIGSWTHVTFSWDGSDMRIYFNGVLENTGAMTAIPWNNSQPFRVGSYQNLAGYSFIGKMSDFRFWTDRALYAADVSQLYLEAGLAAGLIHKWSLDTDGSAAVGSVDLVAHTGATHVDNVGSLPQTTSGFYPATSISLTPSAGYTISTWFKGLKSAGNIKQFTGGGGTGTVGNHAGSTGAYDLGIENGEIVTWDQITGWGRSGYYIASDTSLNTGWHNIVSAYDGTKTTFYVDGVQVGSTVTWAGSPTIQVIGSWKNLADRAPADFLDDVRVWDRTLSTSNITALFTAGAEVPPVLTLTDGLVLQHICEDATADVGTANATYVAASSVTVDGKPAWEYTGQSSIVRLDSNRPSLAGNWTISMWFKGLKGSGWRTAARGYSLDHIIILETGTHNLGVYDNTTNTFVDSGADMNSANFTGWNQLIAVGSGNSTKYYINGVLEGTAAFKSSDSLFAIGNHASSANASYGTQQFADYIGDVRVWDRAISTPEAATLFTAGAEVPAPLTLTDGLVAKYALDTDAADSVGSSDGIVTGATFVTVDSHSAAAFASGDNIHIANAGFNFTTEDFSTAFWFYNDGTSGDWGQLIGNQAVAGSNGFGWSINRYYGNDTLFSCQSGNGTPTWSNAAHPTQFTIPLATWTHVTMVRSGTQFKIYLDGVDSGYTAPAYATIVHQSDFLAVAKATWTTSTVIGKYDDIRIWTRALTATDAATLFAAGAEVPTTDDLIEGLNKFVCSIVAPVGAVGFTKGDEEAVFISSESGYYLWLRENGTWGQYQSAAITTALSYEWMAAADRMYFQASSADQPVFASKRQDTSGYLADGTNRDGLVERFVHGSTILAVVETLRTAGEVPIVLGLDAKFVQVLEEGAHSIYGIKGDYTVAISDEGGIESVTVTPPARANGKNIIIRTFS